MQREIMGPLAKYLEYLVNQPETRTNNALIDCTIFLLQEKPDTEASLNG